MRTGAAKCRERLRGGEADDDGHEHHGGHGADLEGDQGEHPEDETGDHRSTNIAARRLSHEPGLSSGSLVRSWSAPSRFSLEASKPLLGARPRSEHGAILVERRVGPSASTPRPAMLRPAARCSFLLVEGPPRG